ncbi:uncharacterized protein BDZ83DRAFT_653307 [Colletotrichum acutatum]|uniref:Uncharacterized protein n=1 Tax=Glomerella acutata TaxID=27357 RepID=A0AAD8UKC5_GLOAC|nr:uncharacterized protein BDZ83DRAFT_653307 [Colletotrichum acutatum]KAK1723128.1 hypothetical protein BDZ83DRAFT_653307 [Colletotrichum acutatum]
MHFVEPRSGTRLFSAAWFLEPPWSNLQPPATSHERHEPPKAGKTEICQQVAVQSEPQLAGGSCIRALACGLPLRRPLPPPDEPFPSTLRSAPTAAPQTLLSARSTS